MAEPFLLKPWEIGRLTKKQIDLMIKGQNRVVNPDKDDQSAAEPKAEFVSPEFAKKHLEGVSATIGE